MLTLLLSLACHKTDPNVPAPVPEPGPAASAAQAALGDWKGSLALPNGALTIVAHVAQGEGGALSATMDSPDQGSFGIPVSSVVAEGDKLVLDVAAIGGRYEGTFTDGDTISGTWTQGGGSLPLSLSRSADVAPPKRPQEPVPPLPYRTEEVKIESAPGVTLAATLALPEGAGPFPSVVLFTGSGPQDRDESIMGHKPFMVLADHLARKGIASLRADDRGTAESTGDFGAATTPDFAKDAAALLAYLDARPETGAVGCLGHSEGGLVCPLMQRDLAKEARADFLVLLAGPGVTGLEIIVEQGALIAAAEGMPADDVESDKAQSRALFEYVAKNTTAADLKAQVTAKIKESPSAKDLPEPQLAAMADQVISPWFLWFLTYDPVPALQQVGVPTLALFGERDLQVPPAQSSGPMKEALGANGTVEVLAGLNHLFQPAQTGGVSEYAKIEITMDETALEKVSSFILAHKGQ